MARCGRAVVDAASPGSAEVPPPLAIWDFYLANTCSRARPRGQSLRYVVCGKSLQSVT